MKRIKVLLIAVFVLAAGSSFQQVNAQEKTQKEMENEYKIQQQIDEQKKKMAEQKRARDEGLVELNEDLAEMEEILSNEIDSKMELIEKAGETYRIINERPNRFVPYQEPFVWSSPDMQSFFGRSTGDSERTTWDFSKSLKENTFSRDYTFDVEESVGTVIMSVSGDCKAGEIRINIIMPNGKNFSEIVIDEFGNLNWRKSLTITETENRDKTGEWKFQITSKEATGYFKISLQTF